jgi:rod shape-determining protein MreD
VTKSPALWAVAVLLPVLHFLLHVGFGFGAQAPDLLTIGLLVTARHVRPGTAAGLGFALGLVEDSLSTLSFGANATALTVVGFLGARSRDLFMGESLFFLASYLALGTWARMTLHWLLAGEALWAEAPRALLMEAPLGALYAAVIGTILVWVTGAWERESVR